jgi:hypothetical protein
MKITDKHIIKKYLKVKSIVYINKDGKETRCNVSFNGDIITRVMDK